jgi:hypothetical protein
MTEPEHRNTEITELFLVMEELRKSLHRCLEDWKTLQLQHIRELKRVRLQAIEESCQLMEYQLAMIKAITRLHHRQVRTRVKHVKPVWNPATGELWYAGDLIKKFTKPAQNQRLLLDWFRRHHFKSPLRNPWMEQAYITIATETLKNTVDGLNEDHRILNLLRFGTQDNGTKVYWQAFC